jgi:hypothetical protein
MRISGRIGFCSVRLFSATNILMNQVLNFVVDASLFDDVAAVRAYHARLKARPAYERALAALSGGKNAAVAAQ